MGTGAELQYLSKKVRLGKIGSEDGMWLGRPDNHDHGKGKGDAVFQGNGKFVEGCCFLIQQFYHLIQRKLVYSCLFWVLSNRRAACQQVIEGFRTATWKIEPGAKGTSSGDDGIQG